MARVIWRFNRSTVRLQDLEVPPSQMPVQWDLPEFARVEPVFGGSRIEVQDRVERKSSSFKEVAVNDIARYYQVNLPDDAVAPAIQALAEARAFGLVDWFDVQARIGPPTSSPHAAAPPGECEPDQNDTGPTRPFERCQGYLSIPSSAAGARQGVGAVHAWTLQGGRGSSAMLVDLDTGWNLNHEEFQGRSVTRFGSIGNRLHGTAVLGILWGNASDGVGVTGIVPEASIGLAPYVTPLGEDPDPEGMLEAVASDATNPIDVILIEVAAQRITNGVLTPELPLEAFEVGQSAINAARDAGIYVIEVAGNGGTELVPSLGIDPSGPALMVGAGHPATGRVVIPSNFGDRVDLQGWGQEVVTTGSPDDPRFANLQRRSGPIGRNRCYTRSFDGTSSAAAIVAGCVAALSSILKSHQLSLPTPEELKELLQSTGTFPDRLANRGIGPLPNLKAALEEVERRIGGGFKFDTV